MACLARGHGEPRICLVSCLGKARSAPNHIIRVAREKVPPAGVKILEVPAGGPNTHLLASICSLATVRGRTRLLKSVSLRRRTDRPGHDEAAQTALIIVLLSTAPPAESVMTWTVRPADCNTRALSKTFPMASLIA